MLVDSELKWQIHELSITLSNLFMSITYTEQLKDKEQILDKATIALTYLDLYIYGLARGWQKFDWDEAERLGWFSRANYAQLPELKGRKIPDETH